MKVADRPKYFIDPPDPPSSDSEEDVAYRGYIPSNIPDAGEEPLRAGDVICFQRYPFDNYTNAQIREIRSFEKAKNKGICVVRLNDSYAVQLDDNIRRTYVMNYHTGQLEDNRKWALFHSLADFHLVERVICSSTKKEIMWDRLGDMAVLESAVQKFGTEMHKRADGLTRSFFANVPPPSLRSNKDTNDVSLYREPQDIFYEKHESSEEEYDDNETSDADSDLRSNDGSYLDNKESPQVSDANLNSDDSQGMNQAFEFDFEIDGTDDRNLKAPANADENSYSLGSVVSANSKLSNVSGPSENPSQSEPHIPNTSNESEAASLLNLQNIRRKKVSNSWNNPVATYNNWNVALKIGLRTEAVDWKSVYQNNKRKKLICVSHQNCKREMKIVKLSNGEGGAVYLRGSHSLSVSESAYTGRGKFILSLRMSKNNDHTLFLTINIAFQQ